MVVDSDEANLPGAGFNFEDVTDIFTEAAKSMFCLPVPLQILIPIVILEMEPGELIFMEDFTLFEAMSAFEVSEHKDQGESTTEQ